MLRLPGTTSREPKEITPRKIREQWEKGMASTRADREQAAVNHSFLRNKQWVFWNRGANRLQEVPRRPERMRATINRIGPDTRIIMSKLNRRELAFDVMPDSPDDAAIKGSRVAEASLYDVHLKQNWERIRADFANLVWEAGVAAVAVEWDTRAGREIGKDEETGAPIYEGDVKLTALSIHEIATEPGTRDIEKARWWIRGQALPPADVQDTYQLDDEPKADARSVDTIQRIGEGDQDQHTPLSMVYTYYERPSHLSPGRVMTIVGDQVVDESGWPFPFTDRLNLVTAVVEPIHGRWIGSTPLTDAVPVQALYNASWSSIGEHMKLAGNARLFVPMGSLDDAEDLSDTPGEIVEYNPINGMSPRYESPPVMPDWWIRQPLMLEDALDNVLSVHAVSRGDAPTGIESGIGLSILSENDDTPVGSLAKNLAEAWGRIGTMVLKLYEVKVKASRPATIMLPGGIPEPLMWIGGDLVGQTNVKVPLDAVMPRSRSAQAAYAMQLYDRGIIQTPGALAKVADLPDQDDLLEGIDPDTARARRENYWLAVGRPRTVDVIDDHANHIRLHRDFIRSERYENLDPKAQNLCRMHIAAHELYAAQQLAQQTQAAGFSPLAAAIPTEATQVVPSETLADAAAMQSMAPGSMQQLPPEVVQMMGLQQEPAEPAPDAVDQPQQPEQDQET